MFDNARIGPVLITKQEKPTHVIISVEAYQKLVDRLEELEDMQWGKKAQNALKESSMVGYETFTARLEEIANG